jgi:hypothetical protein
MPKNKIIFSLEAIAFIGCIAFLILWLNYPEKNYEPMFTLCSVIFVLTEMVRRYLKPSSVFIFPSLSNFSDYNTRFTLINRTEKALPYKITATTTEGATIIYSERANGAIKPNTNLVLHVNEVLNVVGSSSFSALVTINADKVDVGVSVIKKDLQTGGVITINPVT